MEENLKDMTNDIAELKANIRQIVKKYNITYLGIDINENKDITLSIEL